MVMFMIKGELYKLLRSKSVKVLFILLLVLNSLQIIYVNYQNIYGDINTGKRKHRCGSRYICKNRKWEEADRNTNLLRQNKKDTEVFWNPRRAADKESI